MCEHLTNGHLRLVKEYLVPIVICEKCKTETKRFDLIYYHLNPKLGIQLQAEGE